MKIYGIEESSLSIAKQQDVTPTVADVETGFIDAVELFNPPVSVIIETTLSPDMTRAR